MTLSPALLIVALAAAVCLGWSTTLLWSRSRLVQARSQNAEALAAARTSAEAERTRRIETEARLSETEKARAALDRSLAEAGSEVKNVTRALDEQKKFVEDSKRELENAFKSLAGAALEGNNKQFLDLANERLGKVRTEASADLKARKQAIEELLKPMRETLGKLNDRTGEIEVAREGAYKALREQVEGLASLTASLQEKTTTLATALTSSQVRGRWGEIALRNVAELAGMTDHCDFEEQSTLADGGRPDMTVNLPGGRFIAVDAKAPLAAYLEACDATGATSRDAALDRHVAALRAHVRTLAGREYAAGLAGNVDLVVLFLPGDPFLSAAFARAPDLQVEALRSKVLVATPTTLVALLRTVAIYWQQQALARNAEAIASAARELYDRVARFEAHLAKVGKGLATAVGAYNDAVGSYERRVLPVGARLEDLKAVEGAKRGIEGPGVVEEAPRGA